VFGVLRADSLVVNMPRRHLWRCFELVIGGVVEVSVYGG
jgi:hypothetical protein